MDIKKLVETNKSSLFDISRIGQNETCVQYRKWARGQAVLLSKKEFEEWMVEIKGTSVPGATAWFVNSYNPNGTVNFQSAVNKDCFFIDGTDYSDLIPYIIEHEVWESLTMILIRKGLSGMKKEDAHKLARLMEFSRAEKEGKLDRLYEFFKKVAWDKPEEYQVPYEMVCERFRSKK